MRAPTNLNPNRSAEEIAAQNIENAARRAEKAAADAQIEAKKEEMFALIAADKTAQNIIEKVEGKAWATEKHARVYFEGRNLPGIFFADLNKTETYELNNTVFFYDATDESIDIKSHGMLTKLQWEEICEYVRAC